MEYTDVELGHTLGVHRSRSRGASATGRLAAEGGGPEHPAGEGESGGKEENPEETNRSVLNRESFEERKDARVGRKGQRKLLSGPQPSRVTNGAHTTADAELAYGFITGLYEANDFTFEISLPACGRMFGPITT